jgi:predicted small metal-binding protein
MRIVLYNCQCGWLLRAPDEAQLVAAVQDHAVTAHGLSLTKTQVLALSERVDHRPAPDNTDEAHNE